MSLSDDKYIEAPLTFKPLPVDRVLSDIARAMAKVSPDVMESDARKLEEDALTLRTKATFLETRAKALRDMAATARKGVIS